MNLEEQKSAPIYEALERFWKRRVVPFDVPGHKRGRGNPVSVIRRAEELTVDAFGAAHAFLMVNGTTSSVQSMILSVCKVVSYCHRQRTDSEL